MLTAIQGPPGLVFYKMSVNCLRKTREILTELIQASEIVQEEQSRHVLYFVYVCKWRDDGMYGHEYCSTVRL